MNQLSFLLDKDVSHSIYIDGKPLPGSSIVDWYELVTSMENSGYYEFLTCNCGCATCAGLKAVPTFCVDELTVWRTNEAWYGTTYRFATRALQQAVHDALRDLEWVYFLHGDEVYCPCSTDYFGAQIQKTLAQAAEILKRDVSTINPAGCSESTVKLLGAICRGDRDAVTYWVDAGADLNQVIELGLDARLRHSVLETALVFAPEDARLDIVKLLVKRGADVSLALEGCPGLPGSILNTGDPKIVSHLLARFPKTETSCAYLEDALNSAFLEYARELYDSCRETKGFENMKRPPMRTEEIKNGDLGRYKQLALTLNQPSTRHLELARDALRQLRAACS